MIDVIGYEGLYKIDKSGGVYKIPSMRKMSQKINRRGKPVIRLTRNGARKEHQISTLVYRSFNGNDTGCILHLDGDKTNNHLDNLILVENMSLDNHPFSRSVVCIDKKGKKRNYSSLTECSHRTGLSISHICLCCSGKKHNKGGLLFYYTDSLDD